MTDIRLESMPFELGGRTYELRCNMNVLADVQELHNGDFAAAMTGDPVRSALEFLAAMLNDYADEQGWPERFTAKELGRILAPRELPMGRITEIMALVIRAITPASAPPEAEPGN